MGLVVLGRSDYFLWGYALLRWAEWELFELRGCTWLDLKCFNALFSCLGDIRNPMNDMIVF